MALTEQWSLYVFLHQSFSCFNISVYTKQLPGYPISWVKAMLWGATHVVCLSVSLYSCSLSLICSSEAKLFLLNLCLVKSIIDWPCCWCCGLVCLSSYSYCGPVYRFISISYYEGRWQDCPWLLVSATSTTRFCIFIIRATTMKEKNH